MARELREDLARWQVGGWVGGWVGWLVHPVGFVGGFGLGASNGLLVC